MDVVKSEGGVRIWNLNDVQRIYAYQSVCAMRKRFKHDVISGVITSSFRAR